MKNLRAVSVFGACLLFLIALIVPSFHSARKSRQSPCIRNLRSLAFALNIYHTANGSYPPAYIADKDGKPMYSWRVLILPFLDEKPLFDKYDFSKPWDAPENRFVLENMPDVFRCESDKSATPNTTNYAGVFGKGCAFDPGYPMGIRDIEDGMTFTLLVGEVVDVNIPWTKPEDIDVSLHPGINKPNGFGSRHPGFCNFAFCDGRAQVLFDNIDPEVLDSLFHRNDDKPIDDPF
ncbi:MAG: DUF1559 domain-containing protein [Planctomycetaceae bacterium]